ncbi:hypothetical protein HDU76_013756 [Blyttiomyces sp. JEL0837]|nr:hypothetical protein HDU76_013756 [Blyttiomyces sp. JEL0837]
MKGCRLARNNDSYVGPLLASAPRESWVVVKLPDITVTKSFVDVTLELIETSDDSMTMGLIIDTMSLRKGSDQMDAVNVQVALIDSSEYSDDT